jgi:hypothetical protein
MCGVAVDTLRDMDVLFADIPLDKVTTVDDHQRPRDRTCSASTSPSRTFGASRGRRRSAARPERLPQRVHGAARVGRPPSTGDAHRHRHDRVLRREAAEMAPGLDQRLSHSGGRRDRRARARLHARRWDRLRRRAASIVGSTSTLRPAPLFLLRRAHRLLRGDRQVPRRPKDLGAGDERALRSEAAREHEAQDARADRRASR